MDDSFFSRTRLLPSVPTTLRTSLPEPPAGAFPYLRWLKTAMIAGMWVVAIILAVAFVARDAFKYLEWSEAVFQRFWPNRVLLVVHIVGAGVALLLGPVQFSTTLRAKMPAFHRTTGWLYVIAVLSSTPAALRLSFSSGCLSCIPPFVIWASLTIVMTIAAVLMAVKRSIVAHRGFMMRSYAMVFGFVWVRLDLHLVGTPLEIPLPAGVPRNSSIIWLCWVAPLLVIEAYLTWWPSLWTFRGRRQT